jgi:hypothetical protein
MNNLLLLIIIILVISIFYRKYYINKKEHLTVKLATEIDDKRANKYALKKMCEEGGYFWQNFGDEFIYECRHTKKTCLGESIYPTPSAEDTPPRYYEWRDKSHPDVKTILEYDKQKLTSSVNEVGGETERDGMCIVGMEAYRKWCEDEQLRYDPENGQCYTTKPYCQKKLLGFCNDDCFEPPTGMILSKVFGNTLGKAIGVLSPVDAAVIGACGS